MADDIRSWLAQALISHDRAHGANSTFPCKGGYVQLVDFSSYRTPHDPNAEIRGSVADKTHWVKVRFDVGATDEFEEPQASLPSESLTSHIRAIFHLSSFHITLEPPLPSSRRKPNAYPASPHGELPQVVLLVKEWKVVGGNRNDPVYYGDAQELGRGNGPSEAEIQRVLRKWWFGDSYSDPSQNLSSQLETPSRLTSNPKALASSPLFADSTNRPQKSLHAISSPANNDNRQSSQTAAQQAHPVPGGPETLTEFLKPYLHSAGGKKRAIPEWLFEMPDEAKRQLDDITMFGMNLGDSNQGGAATFVGHTAIGGEENGMTGSTGKGKGKERAMEQPRNDDEDVQISMSISSPAPPPAQGSVTGPTSSPLVPTQMVVPSPRKSSPSFTNDESDGDIPIRPPPAKRRKERDMFDPSAASSSPAMFEPMQLDDEEEEEQAEDEGILLNRPSLSRFARTREASQAAGEVEEGMETDEGDLSDYERQQRRLAKSATSITTQTVSASRRQLNNSSIEVLTDVEDQDVREADELLPESYSQSNPSIRVYGSLIPTQPDQTQIDQHAQILVDESDQSLLQPSQKQLPVSQTPQAPHPASNATSTVNPRLPSEQTHIERPPPASPRTGIKVEHVTPIAASARMTNSSGKGKSSRKSFIESIRFVGSTPTPSPSLSRARMTPLSRPLSTQHTAAAGEVESEAQVEIKVENSPSLKGGSSETRAKENSSAGRGILERIGGWVGDPGYASEDADENGDEVEAGDQGEDRVGAGSRDGNEPEGGADVKAEDEEELEYEQAPKEEDMAHRQNRQGVKIEEEVEENDEEEEDEGYSAYSQQQTSPRKQVTVNRPSLISNPAPTLAPNSPTTIISPITSQAHIYNSGQAQVVASPARRSKKLGGYKLNLGINGLSEVYVQEALKRASQFRKQVKRH